MFLAGKVEETPRQLKDVILVSYEIIQKKDPEAVQKIKQTLLYEQQKEKILIGERVVLATLGFDLNVKHPYKPLMDAISKFVVDQKALRTVAWNFVNDGLRTSLCLQFKPHHIAAGAIFLAAKFLKVKLPSGGEKVWWHEFDVQPRQLEEVSNQMLELYEQNRLPPSISNEAELVTRQVTPKYSCGKEGNFGRNSANREGTFGQLPQGTFGKIDKDKVKAALEKRKKSRGDVTRKTNFLDEDDLIERELEAGIELAAESENNRRQEHEKHQADAGDGAQQGMEEHLNDIDNSFHSPKPNNRKRKV
ncbi:Cyclin-T1-3 [Euphorbia peplus]|nr:Cyclin-T1-3 [Euphorbia peplus]